MFDRDVLAMPGARRALSLLAAASLASALLACGQAVSLARALAALWDGAPLDGQLPLLAAFATCLVARRAIDCVRASGMERFAQARCRELRRDYAAALYDGGAGTARAIGTGSAVSTLVEGIERVEGYIALIVPKVAGVMVEPLVLLVALVAIDPVSAAVSAVVLPFAGLYMVLLGRNAREAAERRHDEYTGLANHFVDSLRGIAALRAFGRAQARAREVFATSERFRTATVQTLRVATLSSLALDLFATFALAAASILLGFRLMAGWVELASALAALMLVPEFFAPVLRFGADFHATLDGKNALAALRAVGGGGAAAPDGAAGPASPLPAGAAPVALTVESVRFGYPARTAGEPDAGLTRLALDDVSFTASGVQKIGIVGASGAGKSTLATLLAGLASPTQGRLTVRGADGELGACSSRGWLDHVCYIPQNPYVFHASLRDNVAFYRPDATDGQVARAIEASGLAELAASLPAGLDTVMGEGGRGVSGGQAQRIALARAFLDGSSRNVLVFDEPTAHLDIETEYALKRPMLALMEGRLVFFATHRLHWMRSMDRILVLDQGRLVEEGSFDELLEKGGAFAGLVRELRGGDAR